MPRLIVILISSHQPFKPRLAKFLSSKGFSPIEVVCGLTRGPVTPRRTKQLSLSLIIGYCFIAIIPVLICIVIVTSKLKAPRRVRCESSRSDLINRSPSTPASYRRSRRKTLSRTDLDEIPIYRTGDFPGSRKRGGTPDVERGITCQQTSSSPDLADQNLTLSRLDSSVSGSKIKNEGANSGYTPLPAKPLLHHNTG
ncbi:unnamed protein product [Penicillium nalgiovense]|uniref:Uncharacterized protein n=1 Tax=Penicillium nalgiovense TaxID=60175 RepID=A0A9W4MSQ6_PENNA|nr:unnamed protein product [Penicillium nalgiovense]CAG8004699.1 unnamed protein product [Penicillium nalgiovense]CAG8008507.1 unnamed protein product [Penicillium nalgiovense]CAG8032370.1 unnamed protein product [Penicillium nalgiovense]CAG8058242.1 unnamed protein product [Penicillium nalgiovense]